MVVTCYIYVLILSASMLQFASDASVSLVVQREFSFRNISTTILRATRCVDASSAGKNKAQNSSREDCSSNPWEAIFCDTKILKTNPFGVTFLPNGCLNKTAENPTTSKNIECSQNKIFHRTELEI